MLRRCIIPVIIILYGIILTITQGCMHAPFLDFGPNTRIRTGTMDLELKAQQGSSINGSINVDAIAKNGDAGGDIDLTNLEYLKIKGNYWEKEMVGRATSSIVVFDGEYYKDKDNETKYFTIIRHYDGNSWLRDVFEPGLDSDKASAPLIQKDNSTQ